MAGSVFVVENVGQLQQDDAGEDDGGGETQCPGIEIRECRQQCRHGGEGKVETVSP